MHKLYQILILLIISTTLSQAREYTKPPSVALRQEATFVAEVKLQTKQFNGQQWQLTFDLIKDLHNSSDAHINILVDNELAKHLTTDTIYVIAYEVQRITKVKGIKRYVALANGPELMRVQGASPAIFRSHPQLIKQLTSDPKWAQTKPQSLVESIMQGMAVEDPKIQEFFVRELVNWKGLSSHLDQSQQSALLNVYRHPDVSVGSLIALLENRTALHQFMGHQHMRDTAMNILHALPTELDPNTEVPNLVLQALQFVERHQLGTWNTYSRWTRTNIPAIAEQALTSAHNMNEEKTQSLIKQRLQETMLSDVTRRVLTRFLKK